MKKICLIGFLFLLFIGFLGCGVGRNPVISIAIESGCKNMSTDNNANCSIQVNFNNGDNINPSLGYVMSPNNIAITKCGASVNMIYDCALESSSFVLSSLACQKKINQVGKNNPSQCIINFVYDKNINVESIPNFTSLQFSVNGIYSNTINITK